MVKTLPGSNSQETFFHTPEAFLQEVDRNNFNLNGPMRATSFRPATFYFLAGAKPWPELFAECKSFETKEPPAGSPPGTVILVAQSPRMEARLLIDRAKGIIRSHEVYLAGKLYSRLTVEKLEQGPDHRVFPSQATLVMFNLKSEKPLRTERLSAQRLVFPKNEEETKAAFALELPKGTQIIDRTLNRQIILKQATPVQDILDRKVNYEPMDNDPQVFSPPEESKSPFSPRVLTVGCVIFLALVGVLLAVRGGHLWQAYWKQRSN
jgi:hypothetical protein